MANMSYCRWENTSGDLADCLGALEEMECRNGVWGEIDEDTGDWLALNEYEQLGIKRIIDLVEAMQDKFTDIMGE